VRNIRTLIRIRAQGTRAHFFSFFVTELKLDRFELLPYSAVVNALSSQFPIAPSLVRDVNSEFSGKLKAVDVERVRFPALTDRASYFAIRALRRSSG
jgi:hypothetical protein